MKKSNQINEREIKRKTHEKKFVGLRAKSYSYLIHDDREDEKGKDTKKVCHRKKRKSENYKNCLEASQIENKINHLEKNKGDIDILKEDQKEFRKNNKLIFKTQKRFKSDMLNVLTEENNKIVLSSKNVIK